MSNNKSTWPTVISGPRTMVRAIIGGDHAAGAGADLAHLIIAETGGFTMYQNVGGWTNPETGEVEVEMGSVIETSFAPNDARLERIISLFQEYAHKMGEKWIHLEIHQFQCRHTEVSRRA